MIPSVFFCVYILCLHNVYNKKCWCRGAPDKSSSFWHGHMQPWPQPLHPSLIFLFGDLERERFFYLKKILEYSTYVPVFSVLFLYLTCEVSIYSQVKHQRGLFNNIIFKTLSVKWPTDFPSTTLTTAYVVCLCILLCQTRLSLLEIH